MGMSELKEMRAKLDRLEATTGSSGAVPLTPKQMMLDSRDVAEKMPDYHIRWVNTKDPNKAQARILEGYERIGLADGGKQLGDLVLMRIPKEKYEARIRRQERLNEERLKQHDRDMEEQADVVAKILRDRYGINVSGENILVRGG